MARIDQIINPINPLDTMPPDAAEPTARPARRARPGLVLFLLQAMVVVFPGAGLIWLVSLIAQQSSGALWITQVVITLLSVLACGWAMFDRWHVWSQPMRRLIDATKDARAGFIPIDELSKIGGGAREIVPVIQEMLVELKRQKQQLLAMNAEMQSRIAGRTDALERKIGSLQVQATRDTLTGLFNRRLLEQELPRAVWRFCDGGPGVCMMMADVDYFKQLNDTLGHAAGDQLLKEIGQIIRSSIGEQDLAFRCGGDEFVILLHGCNYTEGAAKAERIASLVKALTRPLRIAMPPALSIGVCGVEELTSPTPERLMETADKRLYVAKAQRRGPQKRAG